MTESNAPKVVMLVRFRSRLSADEIKRRYPERMAEFRDLPGLLQKYYIYDEPANEWGGIYVWDSEESVQAYLESDLRKTIPATYEVEGTPRVERLEVFDVLR
jgi:heme-degrading monooxygenase HmoA